MVGEDKISESTLKYRIRAQIIWYLEIAASASEQRKYEDNLHNAGLSVGIPSEMMVQWEDWVRIDDISWYSEPEFSEEEQAAIICFHEIWSQVADDIPYPMPSTINELLGTQVWKRLMDGAEVALEVFKKRGHFLAEAEFGFPVGKN